MTVRARVLGGCLVAALAGVAGSAHAQSEKGVFGLGLIVGEPTGVAAKLYLSDDTAIDAAVGGAVIGRGIQVHADHLWHPWVLEKTASFVLPAYVGLGGRFLFHDRGASSDDDLHLGARAVAGALFDFREIPLDVFLEFAGILDLRFGSDDRDHDGVGLGINLAAGARYYF
jgi:hypothetical protein